MAARNQGQHLRIGRFAALKRTPGVERLHVARVVGLVAGARQHFEAEWNLALINCVHLQGLGLQGGRSQTESHGDRKDSR